MTPEIKDLDRSDIFAICKDCSQRSVKVSAKLDFVRYYNTNIKEYILTCTKGHTFYAR